MEKEGRIFSLGQILNITTMKLFTEPKDIYDLMNYLYDNGEDEKMGKKALEFFQKEAEAKDYILSVYPKLKGVGVYDEINSKEDAEEFLLEAKEKYGDEFELLPMQRNHSRGKIKSKKRSHT